MTNDLSQAVQGVYNSSREIMKNKQRHLYISMLDLLTRTTRASGVSATVHLRDDHVKFWYSEVLPLVFEEDRSIQDNAVTALETVLPYLEGTEFQNLPEWPVIKAIIVDQYSKKLHDLRQASNSNWYKIWCLLVRILDKEILKGATVINTFLSIVELGFRSSDYNIRADAFLCWKVLVEIFARHNEIFAPKRIKLICIPLKSSHSKTLETSVNKFKVWWYFLSKLSPKIEEYLDIYESFLVYCFGPSCKQQTNSANSMTSTAQCKVYTKVKQMAIACLIQSMGRTTKEVDLLLNSMGLEHLSHILINKNVMAKCGLTLVNVCFESTYMACDPECKFGKQIESLWKNFGELLALTRNPELYYECFKQLTAMTAVDNFGTNDILQQSFVVILNELSKIKEIPFENEGSINATKLSEALVQLLGGIISSQTIIPTDSISNVSELYSLKNIVHCSKYWIVQKMLISFIMLNKMIGRDLKVTLWKNITASLTIYLQQNFFEFRITENAKILNDWIMWPIKSGLEVDIVLTTEPFLQLWKHVILAASDAEGKPYFTEKLTLALKNIYDDTPNTVFLPIFGYFITAMNSEFDVSCKPSASLELVNRVLVNAHKYNKGSCTSIVQSLTAYLAKLQENQILISFTEWKTIFATILEKENTGAFAKQSADNFKRTLQEKLKSEKAKEKKLLKEIKDLMKSDSQYVIIPTVWSMNPDKLTDHQKEKMKEKRMDIPAMYNDISQSQDTSIKPWTPKKIVIAKSKDSDGEIVIENNIESPVLVAEIEVNQPTELASEALVTSTTNNDVDSPKATNDASYDISIENQQSDEGSNGNDPIKLSKRKRKNKEPKPAKEKKTKAKISEERKKLLDKLNIKPEKNNTTLLRELKCIEIDTVEGNTVVQSRFRDRRPTNTIEKGKKIGKAKQKQPNAEILNTASKKKRPDDKANTQEAPKRKIAKTTRKSLNFDKDKPEQQKSAVKKIKGNSKNSYESMDEVIEPSQTSESVLSKKISMRKSTSASTNNNTVLKPTDKISERPIVQIQQNSLSPQKENSPPNVDETIAETPAVQESFNSPLLDEAKTLGQKENLPNETSLCEADTQPKTELMNASINSSSIMPQNAKTVTSSTQNTFNSVQSPISLSVVKKTPAVASTTSLSSVKPSVVHSEILLPQDASMDEQDTQPNTLNCNKGASELEKNVAIVNAIAAVERKKSVEAEEEATEEVTINDKHNGSVNEMNCSIRSSPECKDIEERNSEFLNNTLNISPIPNNENQVVEGRYNAEQDKLSLSPAGRKIIKPGLHLPISPPERKSTNNAESPGTRPKHVPQLTGRGAQFINMIRNKRIDSTPKPQGSLLMTAKSDEKSYEQIKTPPTHLQPVQQHLSPPKKDQIAVTATPQLMAPPTISTIPHKDLLVFSKVLPSPYASPSASILKRKIHRDSLDEIESPANKRKRVSFHDPPVSLTKEYVKDIEEHTGDKPSLNRCLLPDRTSTPINIVKNNSLKRKGRADSMMEIANYNDTDDQSSRNNSNCNVQIGQTSVEMESLKWNNTSTSNGNGQADVDERCLTPSPSLYFANEEAVLKHITEKYQLETIFEKYTEGDKVPTNKSIRNMTNKLCTLMKQDPKMKTNVLEILSEQHPREFLDHAVQENLSFVVCDRLNYNSIVEFVCEKSKLNEDCRRILLERIHSLLSMDKLSADAQQLMMALLKSHRMSSEEIVKCLKLITDRHSENQELSAES